MLKDERNKNYVKNENPYNKYKNNIHNDVLSLYYQFNHLKNIYRQGWLISLLGMDYENRIESVADHTWSVTMLALSIIEKYNLDLNIEKCMKLAIIHELGEVYSGDIIPNVISKEEKHQIEEAAVDELLSPIGFDNDFKELWLEYDNAESLEADFPIVVAKHKERYNNNNIINDNISNQANDKSKKKIIAEEKNKYPGNVMNFVNFNSYGWKIEPSGSNFEIIKPEVGVTIREGNEIKSGGNQYFEKYKRFSLEDYSKMLKDMAFQPEIDKNLFFQKKIQEENKKDMDNNKKNNISKEISKLRVYFN